MRHLKAEIRPSQLIIRMSNVSGWTPTLGSPPLVWWLYAQTIDKVSSYRLLRCWGFKRGFPLQVLLCRNCQGRRTRPRTLNSFSNSDHPQTPPHTFKPRLMAFSTDVTLLNWQDLTFGLLKFFEKKPPMLRCYQSCLCLLILVITAPLKANQHLQAALWNRPRAREGTQGSPWQDRQSNRAALSVFLSIRLTLWSSFKERSSGSLAPNR